MIAKDVIRKLTQIVDNRKQSAGKLWVGTVKAERRQAQGKTVKYRCQQLAQMVKFSGGVMVTVGQGRDSAGLCKGQGAVDFQGKTEWILIGAGQRARGKTFVPEIGFAEPVKDVVVVQDACRSGAPDIQKLDQFVVIFTGLGNITVAIELFSEFRERNNHHDGALLSGVTGHHRSSHAHGDGPEQG
ncbi:hypothetical protein EJD04_17740 [Salmonella enterica]|nr:hypothetical protein [Salmonella enterica]EAW1620260.1 hypothetical protein [Salmonella enterica subsp. diarizonae]EAN6151709.1 hypothetical protein [Salmonella enterica]EAP3485713.1 hypothetical protein [Salmonella enterica]EAU4681688.1 hypothetical protein [Salmonella enterica]